MINMKKNIVDKKFRESLIQSEIYSLGINLALINSICRNIDIAAGEELTYKFSNFSNLIFALQKTIEDSINKCSKIEKTLNL